jgi:hypothetical protein|tara:strand:- start:510 stop:740 length:231 start_codon:yes stop_codon:yes gene_type:complete
MGKSRSSVKGKHIHNYRAGKGFGGSSIFCRLSVGLPEELDAFLTEISSATKIAKAEIIRRLLFEQIGYYRGTKGGP